MKKWKQTLYLASTQSVNLFRIELFEVIISTWNWGRSVFRNFEPLTHLLNVFVAFRVQPFVVIGPETGHQLHPGNGWSLHFSRLPLALLLLIPNWRRRRRRRRRQLRKLLNGNWGRRKRQDDWSVQLLQQQKQNHSKTKFNEGWFYYITKIMTLVIKMSAFSPLGLDGLFFKILFSFLLRPFRGNPVCQCWHLSSCLGDQQLDFALLVSTYTALLLSSVSWIYLLLYYEASWAA